MSEANTRTPEASGAGALLAALSDRRCHVPTMRVPAGYQRVDAYSDGKVLILLGSPDSNDESHNCDEMGCGSMDHVLYRFNLGG